jgi:Flp pilus assembly protein TadD
MTCRHSKLSYSRANHSRYGAVLAVLAAMMTAFSGAAAFEQNSASKTSDVVTIEGKVQNPAGEPVADATVVLEEKGNSAIIETKTAADGTFLLSSSHAGAYTVQVRKSGWLDSVVNALQLSLGDKKYVDLVLTPQGSVKLGSSATQPVHASPGAMEFKDEPNFTVAGVTDWSNLGLHGSAASSRTSESLAKETVTLKSSEPTPPAGNLSQQYRAALAFRDKGDFASARDQVQKALAVADNAEGHRLLGELNERLKDPLDAVREYEQAVRMDPSEQNYFEWGTELLLHKAAQPAVEVFTRGSAAHPNSARMLTGLGVALYASGSYDEAARHLCEASDLQPADPAPYLFLGKIETTSPATLPCSERKLARFAQQQPTNALANYYYAISLSKREKGSDNSASVKQAEGLFEKAVGIDPRLDEAYLQLGILHFARGDFDQAIREFKKATDINPHLSEAHRQLGLIYQRAGDGAKAQQEFQVYEQIEKIDAAEIARQQKELRQFLIILKDQPANSPPR